MSSQLTDNGIPTVSTNEILAGVGKTHEVAGPSDVLRGAGEVNSVQPLTSLQRAGMQLAVGVGIISVVALIFIMGAWIIATINIPQLPDLKVAVDAKILENYKTAYAMAAEMPLQWFDGMVVKILYPLFTLILGYIFGVQSQSNESAGG